MTTDKQIAANRRNAQLSTGPKTPEGKKQSRLNAFKHGMNAAGFVIPSCSKARYCMRHGSAA